MKDNKYEPAILEFYNNEECIDKQKSLIAFHSQTAKVIAVGNEVENISESADIVVITPFRQGIIYDFTCAEKMMKYLVKRNTKSFALRKPKIAIEFPIEYSEIQKKALVDMLMLAGARGAFLINDNIEIPQGGYAEICKKFKCQLLIRITQENHQVYIREKLVDLIEYANKFGVSQNELNEMLKI